MAKVNFKTNKLIEKMLIIIPIIIIIYIVFDYTIGGLISLQTRSEPHFVSVNTFVNYNMGNKPQFYVYGQDIFLATTEGIFVYNTEGNLAWEVLHNMYDPVLIGNEGFIAVAQPMGNTLHVANRYSVVYTANFNSPILTFTVNSQGVSAVILENEGGYHLYVHDAQGNIQKEVTFAETNVFPTAISISNDGHILAISFLDINSANIASSTVFFYMNQEEHESYIDGMFGATARQENQVIGSLTFMDNIMVALSTDKIMGINTSRDDLLNVLWYIEFENEVTHVAFPNNQTIAIAYADGTIKFYDYLGNRIGTYEVGTQINYMSAGHGSIIVGTGTLNRNFYAITNRGNLLWHHIAIQDVNQMLFLNDTSSALLATPINGQILQRQETQDAQ